MVSKDPNAAYKSRLSGRTPSGADEAMVHSDAMTFMEDRSCAKLNAQDYDESTALTLTSCFNKPLALRYLHLKDANSSTEDKGRKTALDWTLQEKNEGKILKNYSLYYAWYTIYKFKPKRIVKDNISQKNHFFSSMFLILMCIRYIILKIKHKRRLTFRIAFWLIISLFIRIILCLMQNVFT